jgi:hypothetical protein
MTYGEKIAEMKKTISTLYDDAEWLRDMATMEEKKFWNEFRGVIYDVDKPLKGLQRIISDSRDKTEI